MMTNNKMSYKNMHHKYVLLYTIILMVLKAKKDIKHSTWNIFNLLRPIEFMHFLIFPQFQTLSPGA